MVWSDTTPKGALKSAGWKFFVVLFRQAYGHTHFHNLGKRWRNELLDSLSHIPRKMRIGKGKLKLLQLSVLDAQSKVISQTKCLVTYFVSQLSKEKS